VLTAAQSKSPFPRFLPDILPAQAKVVQDYVSRIRAQVVRILESQGVPIPAPAIGSVHSIRLTLGFVDIAFDECRPHRMAGYGEVPEAVRTEVSGLVDEVRGIIARLDRYLGQGQSGDLENRLRRLEEAGSQVALVKLLEGAISHHGLVEFRPALATIVDRLESQSFEIAVFGRVSSGKSSLLNHIVAQDVLPVGITPITAVPTRLVYGPEPRATAWFADRPPEHFSTARLAEFVTEEHNPANVHHVTRIVVELPAPRLREGVVYVDTPGLGSLATAGAAETKAYLPRCDLGVVLIDAGSTLTHEDLATVQALYDAGIPASVLLSKADVLAPADRERAGSYVAGHIQSDLGLSLPVHAVSVKDGYTDLLEKWLASSILPLYDRHAELARQSLNRKIGALRLGVEAALAARLKRSVAGGRGSAQIDPAHLRDLETSLRMAAGGIAEARAQCLERSDGFRTSAEVVIHAAAAGALKIAAVGATPMKARLEQAAAEQAAPISLAISEAALKAGRVLAEVGAALDLPNRPEPNELAEVLQDMPRFDLGNLEIDISPSQAASLFGRRWAVHRLRRRVESRAGQEIEDALRIYARLVHSWCRKTFAELQERFDSYADAYRAQLARLAAGGPAATDDDQALRDDLAALATAIPDATEEAPGAAA
jgi:GTP-binding protein EngB required for normal cell division